MITPHSVRAPMDPSFASFMATDGDTSTSRIESALWVLIHRLRGRRVENDERGNEEQANDRRKLFIGKLIIPQIKNKAERKDQEGRVRAKCVLGRGRSYFAAFKRTFTPLSGIYVWEKLKHEWHAIALKRSWVLINHPYTYIHVWIWNLLSFLFTTSSSVHHFAPLAHACFINLV